MIKVLITGASGFLGSHLLKNFIESKYEVVVLTRSSSNLWRIKEDQNNFTSYNIDEIKIIDVFKKEKPEIIIHTACSYGRNNQKISELVKTNLVFALEVFEASLEHEAKTFINTGSLLPRNINDYSISKAQFSDWLKKYSNKINVVNLKIEHMYGPKDDETKFLGWLIKKMMLNSNEKIDLTSGDQKRDFIYIDDVVDVFNLIINSRQSLQGWNEFDIGTGDFISVKDFVTTIALDIEQNKNIKILRKLNFGAIPYRNGEIMEPVLDNSKIKQLGWEPKTKMEKGIKETLKNYL